MNPVLIKQAFGNLAVLATIGGQVERPLQQILPAWASAKGVAAVRKNRCGLCI